MRVFKVAFKSFLIYFALELCPLRLQGQTKAVRTAAGLSSATHTCVSVPVCVQPAPFKPLNKVT